MPYALITGASRGIGRALAAELAGRGYSLLLTARSADQLAQVAAELSRLPGVEARFLALDLAEPGAALQLAAWVREQTSELAVLVNNAGYGLWGGSRICPWPPSKICCNSICCCPWS
ncbi:SDR family NAD(P)-dependent oxidoreductase [Hymenobacter cellulosilyticus]|uniref:SDR family NAD(P)-dependent oxidoreductase n=1 Tax=Hymenobacter cellulosilyticus TaxID=2932248 RepID=UPI00288051FC|nr:SDR family NAD(P)-dependent oxidoreductase [Hymenobacter cellulosilyticus]